MNGQIDGKLDLWRLPIIGHRIMEKSVQLGGKLRFQNLPIIEYWNNAINQVNDWHGHGCQVDPHMQVMDTRSTREKSKNYAYAGHAYQVDT